MIVLTLYQIFFRIVVFGSWLSIIFHVAGKIWRDEVLFASLRNAILLYIVSILVAIILSHLCFRVLYLII